MKIITDTMETQVSVLRSANNLCWRCQIRRGDARRARCRPGLKLYPSHLWLMDGEYLTEESDD